MVRRMSAILFMGRWCGLRQNMYAYTYMIARLETAVTHVTFTEFRAKMAEHLDRVESDRSELVVTRQNHEPVVVMPLAELEGLRETLHLLASEANADRLRNSIAQLDAGQGVERSLVK